MCVFLSTSSWVIFCIGRLRCVLQLHSMAAVFGFERACVVKFALMGVLASAKVQMGFLGA
uniref:Uncharacterized protein n=1 Tax=Physcomitrium patens TaxID=3218 RepID=A0A2K1K8J0_PHYPA|nr:hypothetical protein PHYPA_011986 [Physcomitrium patens]